MYGLRQLANKAGYAQDVEERMRSVGRFKFKQENVEIKDYKAIAKLSLKFAWGDFPATFELKKKIIGGW